MQLSPALVSTVNSRCKPELLPVTSEQCMAMPGGINVNTSYIISGCSPFVVPLPLQSALHWCAAALREGSGSCIKCCCHHRSLTCCVLLPCCAEWRANLGNSLSAHASCSAVPLIWRNRCGRQHHENSVYHFLLCSAEVSI